jgi:hypothetical protein
VTSPTHQCHCTAAVDGINQIPRSGFLSVRGHCRHVVDRRNILRSLIVRTLQATRQIVQSGRKHLPSLIDTSLEHDGRQLWPKRTVVMFQNTIDLFTGTVPVGPDRSKICEEDGQSQFVLDQGRSLTDSMGKKCYKRYKAISISCHLISPLFPRSGRPVAVCYPVTFSYFLLFYLRPGVSTPRVLRPNHYNHIGHSAKHGTRYTSDNFCRTCVPSLPFSLFMLQYLNCMR